MAITFGLGMKVYIPCMMKSEIDVVNEKGHIWKRLPYSETDQGKRAMPFVAGTRTPLTTINQKIYIPQSA